MERLILIIFLILLPWKAHGQLSRDNLHVCSTCAIKSIGQAVNQALSGDTIVVSSGIYQESNLIIDKPLRILGESVPSRPVIDINGVGSGFLIHSNNVEIAGFAIKNSGLSQTEEMAGIKILQSKHSLIKNNLLENNTFGIYIADSNSISIIDNQIYGTHKSESLSGNGIHIWKSENISVENNISTQNRDGIYFEFVKNSTVRKNKSTANLRYGLHFMYSHDNEYRENLFQDNECGVAVMYSHGVRMFRNRFERNHGPSSYGILLKDISDSVVGANIFSNNTTGIFMDGTTRTEFERNVFINNGWAVRILGDTDGNHFSYNDFLGNTFDMSTNANSNQNEFVGNYWSQYKGLDLNKDGFGDEPYQFVKLSSLLMEHFEVSILLIHSLFFSMLDEIEAAVPALTPKTFRDRQPRMSRGTDL